MIISSSRSRSDLFAKPWPGFRSWFVTTMSCIAVFEFLAIFAWKAQGGRIADLTVSLIGIPAGAFAVLVFIAGIWAFFASVSLGNALGFLTRFLPIAWAIPLFDLIRTYGNGVVIGPPKLNGLEYLLASATGGILPMVSGIPVGMRLGIFLGACGAGIVAWQASHRWWKGIVTGLAVSAVFVSLVSATSFLAFSRAPFSAESWNAKPIEITRRATIVLSQGYWWNGTYDRFPSAIDGQTDIAMRLASAGHAVFILGIVLFAGMLVFQKSRWSTFKHLFFHRAVAEMLIALGIGIGSAWTVLSSQTKGWTFACAAGIGIFVLLALRISRALRHDLASVEQDERSQVSQPLTRGDMSPESARSIATASEWYAVAGAWMLGWPIVASVVVFLAASMLIRDRSWSAWPLFRSLCDGVSLSALSVAGYFFLSQKAVLAPSALAGALAAFLLAYAVAWVERRGRVSRE